MKKRLILLTFLMVIFCGYTEPARIDPTNNAVWHNSMGLEYVRQGNYSGAISEYKTAIALIPDKSASAAFHNNLGLLYLKLRRPDWATVCFENAIQLNPNTFYFYENLVDSYAASGELNSKYYYYKQKSVKNFENSYNWLILGLIQLEKKEYKQSIDSFNNYILLEPEIVVSQAVKTKINEIRRLRI